MFSENNDNIIIITETTTGKGENVMEEPEIMNIFYDSETKDLTIYLPQTVDSNNNEEVLKEIKEAIAAYFAEEKNGFLYLDAKDTKYMSSAGIRVIIILRKTIENLAIINTEQMLYETLSLTGVCGIVNVLPPIKEFSIENFEIIGGGENSKVYRINDDKICKLFSSKNTLKDVLREKNMSYKAIEFGIPTALSFQVIKSGEQYGLIYEMLDYRTLSEILIDDFEKIDTVCTDYVKFLDEINSVVIPGLVNAKEVYENKVLNRIDGYIEPAYIQKLRIIFDAIPEGNGFVHGDLHFANLFKTDEGMMIIDMDSAKSGDRVWEMAAMYSTFMGFRLISSTDVVHLGSLENYPVIFEKILDTWNRNKGYDKDALLKNIASLSLARVLCYAISHNVDEEKTELVKKELFQILDK